jgi:signal transduction histidine kinase
MQRRSGVSSVLDYLPKGNTLSDEEWHRRHRLLQWLLAAHLPALFVFGVLRGFAPDDVAETLTLPLACLIIGHLMRSRRLAASFITLGLVYCSAALVGFSDGAIEAHFHFFIIIGFIALYQDWVPFLLDIVFTVLSHGIGSSFVPDLMFNHASAQQHPWQWSLIHGAAVLAACIGVVLFWKNTEDEQNRSLTLTTQLADAEISRRRFTSDLLVNLARRNQNLLYRQLDLLNDLEDKERDPDALADLFRLDHLATRIRRNAENLLVLSGEEAPRTWREPIRLADVMRAAIAEIEDLDRVDESVDEMLSVSGRSVADLTHLFAELLENAVHFSPPGVTVVVRSRPLPSSAGTQLVTIEDWGVGMTPGELAAANEVLRRPREVDLSVSQRLGLHVVARLAQRYGIVVELTATPGGGVTAVATLPSSVFERSAELVGAAAGRAGGADAGWRPDTGPQEGFAPAYDHVPASDPYVNGTSADLRRSRPFDDPHPSFPGGVRTSSPDGLDPTGPSRQGGGPEVRRGPERLAGTPAIEAPLPARRPMPPLPPDPVDEVATLPRRGPGEAMARNRTPFAEPVRADLGRTRTEDDWSGGGQAEPFQGRAAGGDGAAQPGREPGPTGNGHTGNGHVGGSAPAGEDGWSSWWTRSTPPTPGRPQLRAEARIEPRPEARIEPGPEARIDPRPEARIEPRPEPQAEAQPEPRPESPAAEPRPEPNAAGAASLPEPRPPADERETQQLRRRVPQANLAAGLRREAGSQPEPDEAPVVRDPMAARNALSRFQAAQRAARDAVDGERTDGGPR